MTLPNHNTALENILIRYAISLKKSVVRPKAIAAINKIMYEETLELIKTLPTLADLPEYQEARADKWKGYSDGVVACGKRLRQAAAERYGVEV